MNRLTRPDGVEIAWDDRGEGPLVVLANQFFSGGYEPFGALVEDLAADHRVAWYDVRGTGASSHAGPFEMHVDVADLQAVIEAAGQRAEVLIGMADGCNRAVRLAGTRPDLAHAVVCPAGNPAPRRAAVGTDSLASSQSVLDALVAMIRTDYRGALNSMISTANPSLSESEVRERVARTSEHCDRDTAAVRMDIWIEDDSLEHALAMGDRLWLLEHGTNPWFTAEVAIRMREFLPEANIHEVADGAVSRPDITADVVRRLTREAVGTSEASQTRQ